jgi:hypothetical protein
LPNTPPRKIQIPKNHQKPVVIPNHKEDKDHADYEKRDLKAARKGTRTTGTVRKGYWCHITAKAKAKEKARPFSGKHYRRTSLDNNVHGLFYSAPQGAA